ncbi:MAG TPA: hypothetical protein PLC42_06375 [Parachlamydiaceae bacterium]|nr:hypothetical protein [Parachlamydiaceae bacterium]
MISFLFAAQSFSFDTICFLDKLTDSLQLYLGPEIYQVYRTRNKGSTQNGLLYGIKGGYDRIKRYKVYYGFEALYASGILCGESSSGKFVKSRFSDNYVEGRLGYTFQSKCRFKPSFTPFAGIGYFVEKNNCLYPKDLPFHFKTTYLYAAAGFLSKISLSCYFDLGFNFKVKYPYDAICRVSNDPKEQNSKQAINEEFQYRFELPLTYQPTSDRFRVSLVPFYEYRQYGYRPNFPYDFLKTRLNLYGAQLKLIYCL